jgi:hypothetical protein
MSETPSESPPIAARRCQNCGAPLLGEHCYACGQPVKGLVRHFSSIIGDFLDSVFNFDTRTLRTLGPLLFKPGHLSNEYFYGHRVRYVSPVRLFFFLCIAAFFAAKLAVDIDLDGGAGARNSAIAKAESVADATRLRDEALTEMRAARERIPDTPGARVGMDVAIAAVETEAKQRIAWLTARDEALARGESPPPYRANIVQFDLGEGEVEGAGEGEGDDESEGKDESRSEGKSKNAGGGMQVRNSGLSFNGKPWDPVENPIVVDWLSERGNAWLNQLAGRARGNIERIQERPALLVDAFIEALPQMLFVLLPVFALMLKLLYLFKRRLYMEHLIVTLHSHAFLCAALLLLIGFGVLRDQTGGSGFWYATLGWLEVALAIWMPAYLLVMQKRIYRQGWIMTVLKYAVLGLIYVVLLSIGAAINLAVTVVAM